MSRTQIDSDVPRRAPIAATSSGLGLLAWRYFKHARYNLLSALIIVCGVPTLLYGLMQTLDTGLIRDMGAEGVSLQRLFFMMEMGAFSILLAFEMVHIRPLYTLPLTTRHIVHSQLFFGTVWMVTLHMLTAAWYALVFGAAIPAFRPLLFLLPGVFIVAGLAALLADFRWWRALAAVGVMISLAWLSGARFTDPALMQRPGAWITPTPREILLLIVLAIAGYGLAIATAARDRRGETRSWRILEERLRRLLARIATTWPARREERSPGSPTAAQFAYEWRTRAMVLPALAAGVATLSLLGAYFEPVGWLQGYVVSLPWLLLIGMGLNGFFVGLIDAPQGCGMQMDRYRATRPVSDAQLATAAVKCGLAGTLVALCVSGVCAALVYVYALAAGHSSAEIGRGVVQQFHAAMRPVLLNYPLALLTMLMLGWALFGFNLSTILAGRHGLLTILWCGIMGMLAVNIIMDRLIGHETAQAARHAVAGVIGVAAMIVTCLTYAAARSRGLISSMLPIVGAGLWLTAVGVLLITTRGRIAWNMPTLALLAGVAALVALPPASTPLAVWWNRHR